VCLGPVGADRLRGDEFRQGPVEVGLLLGRECRRRDTGECPGRGQAYSPYSIAQPGGSQPRPRLWRQRFERRQGSGPHQGVCIAQRRLQRRQGPWTQVRGEERQRCRPRHAWLALVPGEWRALAQR
jgi:hypothetical protein